MDIPKQFFCRLSFSLVFFLTLSRTGLAVADIYKCTQDDGSPQFSDVPCKQGVAEPVVLIENSALDSTEERDNIARYQQQVSRQKKSARLHKQQVLMIGDSYTEERNARITATERKVSKKKKKRSKKKKSTS